MERSIDGPEEPLNDVTKHSSPALVSASAASPGQNRLLTITLISSDYLPSVGGVATHVHELARALATMGHHVCVLSFRNANWKTPDGWRVQTRMQENVPAKYLSLISLPGERLKYWNLRRQVDRLKELRGTPRLLHVHDNDYGQYVAHHVETSVRIFTNHTSGFLQQFDDPDLRASRLDELRQYDHVIAPSIELAEKTASLGYPKERVTFIANGVDPARFKPDEVLRQTTRRRLGVHNEEVMILCARRFVPKNGVIDLAHGLRFLDSDGDRIRVVFAGNGVPALDPLGYEYECLAAIRASRTGRRAILLGPVPNDRMPELYAAADMSVLPSLKEATSIAGLEAMSMGLPIVGTRVGGIPDLIVPEKTGLLVEPGDPRELAAALLRLVRDRELSLVLGMAARQRVLDHFTWNKIAQRTVEVYKVALAPGSAVPHAKSPPI